jgi:hypothetical protein
MAFARARLIQASGFGNPVTLTDDLVMPEYKYTAYFENEVLRKRPYIKREWCINVIENPLRVDVQGDTRVRFWGEVPEFGNRVFRVVTLADRVTIHNAFPDSGFKL